MAAINWKRIIIIVLINCQSLIDSAFTLILGLSILPNRFLITSVNAGKKVCEDKLRFIEVVFRGFMACIIAGAGGREPFG
uniref:Uncharacterized protein n=1 Tax=Pyxicephalus adspersus TaxID=30357 RepID=A0AAV3ARM0_PYXAD|nr:TPA: hypothetical protein GDO54_008412 [Pyxicephalus adspersus]